VHKQCHLSLRLAPADLRACISLTEVDIRPLCKNIQQE
jgi:hypothetical protein